VINDKASFSCFAAFTPLQGIAAPMASVWSIAYGGV
jgi:hypothetical protein